MKQELTGATLNEFLLKRAGHTWDDVTETRASNEISRRTTYELTELGIVRK
ncbi:MAG: hypothetical protein LBR26_12480 [Prevotella sp.]|nr:hypothetical protein [Prevotella sp.]